MSIYDKSSLVLIPSGTKTGKVYSQKPVSGDGDFTFTRASAATRVNADGNIEKETQNLLLQSNSFDVSANWVNTFSSETSGQSGYDGTNNAWLLTKTDAGGRIHQNFTTSGVITYSVYLKANASNYALIQLNGSGADKYMYVDLTNGNKGSLGGGNIDENIEDVGSGWYRCSVTANTDATRVRIYPANSTGDVSATSGSIYIQDAQVNYGLVPQEVITTTTSAVYGGITDNTPRLDYTDSSCPALLLEPQRTNAVSQSEYFGAWTPSGLTIIDNDATSPEGVSNASKLTLPSGSVTKRIALGSMPVTSVARSYSFFVKSDDITAVQLVHSGDLQGYARFNISTGVVGSTGNKTTSDIEDYGNGWYRCIANFDSTNAFGSTIYLYISDDAAGGYGGSTSAQGDLFVYGAQYEASSYATSYIPTYGSSVTRNSDITYKYNATSIVGTTEGVMFIDCVPPANDNPILMQLINNTSVYSQSIYFEYVKSINKIRCNAYDSGILQASFQLDAVIGNQYKIALAYKENDFAFYVNGSLIGTDTNASVQSGLQDILIGVLKGSFGSHNFIGNYVNQALVFKTRLSNEELAALTTI